MRGRELRGPLTPRRTPGIGKKKTPGFQSMKGQSEWKANDKQIKQMANTFQANSNDEQMAKNYNQITTKWEANDKQTANK